MNYCFECGEVATENHHIIPKVSGGIKTIPLCSKCHMKVHDIGSKKRIDNHSENIKKGMDKIRANDLWTAYYLLAHEKENRNSVISFLSGEMSENRAVTLVNRLSEHNNTYWFKFFSDLGFFKRAFILEKINL